MKLLEYILIFSLCVILPNKFMVIAEECDDLVVQIKKTIKTILPTAEKIKMEVDAIANDESKPKEIQAVIKSISDNALSEFNGAIKITIEELDLDLADEMEEYMEHRAKRTQQIQAYSKKKEECAKQKGIEGISYASVLKCNEIQTKMIVDQLKESTARLSELLEQINKGKTRIEECLNLLKGTENDATAHKNALTQALFSLGQIAPELATINMQQLARTAVDLKISEKLLKKSKHMLSHCYAERLFGAEIKFLRDHKFDAKECEDKPE